MMHRKMSAGVLRVLSRIREHDRARKNNTQNPAPWTRLLAALTAILLSALSRNAFFVLTILAEELLRLALLPAEAVRRVTGTVLSAAEFTALIMMPGVFLGHPSALMTVTLRAGVSVLILANLNEIVSWKEMTGTLRQCHVPDVFLFTLDSTIRFLVLLGRFSERILEAVDLRTVRPADWRSAGVGGILGTTFLKSQKMSRETAEAMACRCFNGEYPSLGRKWSRGRNGAILLLIPVMAAWFVYCQKAMGL